ncbi:MAG: hypothetical protein KKD21_13595, partial [Proteobacteria bacterium]|nr:hypothetical protein [Pseudomonadota bacterium]
MGASVKENSTEKLLDVIRGVSRKKPEIIVPTSPPKIEPVNLKKIKKKTLNLGVLLNPEDITFVLSSNKQKRLIKWATFELPDELGIEDKGFALFLESRLEAFTEGLKGIPTWCTIDSAKLKLRNITIPDVALPKIANAAFWGLKKEVDFDADQEIFDFEIIGDRLIQDVKRKNLLVFTIEKTQVNQLKTLFSKVGFNLKGITTIPFALQNFIHSQHLQMQDSPFTIVNISRKSSEIVCFSNTGILLTRIIRTGSYNLVDDFIKSPDKTVVKYLSSLKSIQSEGFLKIKLSCERLIEKIVRTSEYCSQNFADNAPMKKFFFIGETADCDPFMEFAATTTLTDVEHLDPVFDTLPGSVNVPYPENAYERGLVTTTFAISLSSNDYTNNFLFTSNDKLNEKKKQNINIAASIIFVLIFIFCTAFANWQGFAKNREMTKLDELVQVKNNFNPNINQESMVKMISGTEQKIKSRNQYISDYFPLAVINEICLNTPANISVSSLEADFSDQNKKKNEGEQNSKEILAKVIIIGSVGIDSDSDFTEYILNLGNSKIFGDI